MRRLRNFGKVGAVCPLKRNKYIYLRTGAQPKLPGVASITAPLSISVSQA
jgi:hypothetical protein